MTWIVVVSVAALCVALRSAVPVLLARRGLPDGLQRRLERAVPALLAGLFALQVATAHGRPAVDARAAGVVAAAAVYVRWRSLVGALVCAAAVTALLRLV
jgi:branched-subunit amino acid transport protein